MENALVVDWAAARAGRQHFAGPAFENRFLLNRPYFVEADQFSPETGRVSKTNTRRKHFRLKLRGSLPYSLSRRPSSAVCGNASLRSCAPPEGDKRHHRKSINPRQNFSPEVSPSYVRQVPLPIRAVSKAKSGTVYPRLTETTSFCG